MAQKRSGKLKITLPSNTEIHYSRVFDAPKHLVFEAFTRPEHVRRWWGCMDGFTMTVCDIDLRVGGTWRYVIVGPDHNEVAFNGVYKEIAAPDRLVNTEIFEMFPDAATLVTSSFVERDGKTHYEALQTFPDQASRDAAIASGMEEGADLGYDRLEEVARSLMSPAAAGPADDASRVRAGR
ncbi:MAG: SRPBCC family protein [Kofleriaceae bacterium]